MIFEHNLRITLQTAYKLNRYKFNVWAILCNSFENIANKTFLKVFSVVAILNEASKYLGYLIFLCNFLKCIFVLNKSLIILLNETVFNLLIGFNF